MLRSIFLNGIVCAAAAGAVPSPSSAPRTIEDCDSNAVIPYDRPLEFKGESLDGPYFDLIKYRGFAVWINLFASWCPPCNDEQPDVVAAAERYYSKGLRVIGVYSDDTDDRIRAYRKKYGIRYPLVRDQGFGLTRSLQGAATGNVFYPAQLFLTSWGSMYCFWQGESSAAVINYKVGKILTTVKNPLPADPVPMTTPAS